MVMFVNGPLILNFNKIFAMLCKWYSNISVEISSHKSVFLLFQVFSVLLWVQEEILLSSLVGGGVEKSGGVKIKLYKIAIYIIYMQGSRLVNSSFISVVLHGLFVQPRMSSSHSPICLHITFIPLLNFKISHQSLFPESSPTTYKQNYVLVIFYCFCFLNYTVNWVGARQSLSFGIFFIPSPNTMPHKL